jgi:hypothetical protein
MPHSTRVWRRINPESGNCLSRSPIFSRFACDRLLFILLFSQRLSLSQVVPILALSFDARRMLSAFDANRTAICSDVHTSITYSTNGTLRWVSQVIFAFQLFLILTPQRSSVTKTRQLSIWQFVEMRGYFLRYQSESFSQFPSGTFLCITSLVFCRRIPMSCQFALW